jgi:hypothetical protein
MERRCIRARSAREAPQAPRLCCEAPPVAQRQQARDIDACRHRPSLAASRRALQVTTTSQIAVTPAAVAQAQSPVAVGSATTDRGEARLRLPRGHGVRHHQQGLRPTNCASFSKRSTEAGSDASRCPER